LIQSFSVDDSGDDSSNEHACKKHKKNKSTIKVSKKKQASASNIIDVDSNDEKKASKSGHLSVANSTKIAVTNLAAVSYTAAPADGAADSSASLTSNTESPNDISVTHDSTITTISPLIGPQF
jgi:hypothetical protein